jgi:hypothetical protein
MSTGGSAAYDGGYVHDPEGAERYARSLPHGGTLARAAPHLLGDGEGQDLMPYLAWYEAEIRNGDGSTWKPKGVEPPYVAQVGNNCTSRGDQAVMDLLQCVDAVTRDEGESDEAVPYRTSCEATYAFSLLTAGMRGDQGCTGHATARSAATIGRVGYRETGPPYEEDRGRLLRWANDPRGATEALREKAAPYRLADPVQIKTTAEARAWIANRGLITIASGVGFETPRDERGICEERGRWMHQMALVGYICSDGVPSFVVAQSWGPNNPRGPRPFHLPGFCFRARESVVQKILGWNDSWGHRAGPGFERRPLPARWRGVDWSGA